MMALLTFLPTAFAALTVSFIVTTTAQAPPGFRYDTTTPIGLTHGKDSAFHAGAQYRASGQSSV
jgi:hypothetical protein